MDGLVCVRLVWSAIWMALVSDDFVSWVDVLFSSGLVIAVVMDDCGLVGLLVGWSSYGFVC